MQKRIIEPGKKYRGSGCLNEYGQWTFTPDGIGTKPDNMKVIKENRAENFSLYESRRLYVIKIYGPKQLPFFGRVEAMVLAFGKAIKALRQYMV